MHKCDRMSPLLLLHCEHRVSAHVSWEAVVGLTWSLWHQVVLNFLVGDPGLACFHLHSTVAPCGPVQIQPLEI